jgi:hypothetical protein
LRELSGQLQVPAVFFPERRLEHLDLYQIGREMTSNSVWMLRRKENSCCRQESNPVIVQPGGRNIEMAGQVSLLGFELIHTYAMCRAVIIFSRKVS